MGISLGLVGLGDFGNCFAPLFKNHPLVDRVALCDTQHWLHAPMSVRAMEAGKHVYCAVPLTTVPDADEILGWCDKVVETARRTGQLFMFGETTFYRPQAMYCRRRLGSRSGQEHARQLEAYGRRGIVGGTMHYPTHSTGGPMSVMQAHAVKVSALPFAARLHRDYYGDSGEPSNETALFLMSNGAHLRICEYREVGHPGREMFRIYGNRGCFENDAWCDKKGAMPVAEAEMRDPLPPEVIRAFQGWKKLAAPDPAKLSPKELADFLGGHGGSHAYLVHEFVSAVAEARTPACTAWDAAHFTAAGATAHKSALNGGAMLDVPHWSGAPEH